MGSDGDEQSKPVLAVDDKKGKGKSSAANASGSAGSLLTGVMKTAQSSVNPANLSSFLGGSGKPATIGLPSSSSYSSQTLESANQNFAGQTSASSRLPSSGTLHQSDESRRDYSDSVYRQFADSAPPRLYMNASFQERLSSPALVGPYTSAQSLDAALHHQVRTAASSWNEMDEAWSIATERLSPEEMNRLAHDPAYHEAWAQNIPAPMFGDSMHDWQQGEQLDNLLQSVSISDQPTSSGPTPMNIMALLDEEEREEERYIDHERGHTMSEEQREMHRALHTLQNSKEREDEKVRPPDDNEAARTGVYAATPTEALQAIWNGSTEGERASAHVRDSQSSEGNVTRKIREILKRGSYVDDVYGLPPELESTIVQAEEAETEENKDRRAKAISRLDALYRHLGATPQPGSIGDFVKDW
ncbi:hypothetical protein CBS101457_002647 [Exobasidium rhododendri]|nr:hypothetical protein CBS101457_002647 [Exobasidium rhododendri]